MYTEILSNITDNTQIKETICFIFEGGSKGDQSLKMLHFR